MEAKTSQEGGLVVVDPKGIKRFNPLIVRELWVARLDCFFELIHCIEIE